MNFDLQLENYSRDELIEMFELPNNFDKNIIEIKENYLKNSILNNTEISKETKGKTLNFIVKAKNIILNGMQKNDNLESIAKNKNLDSIAKNIDSLFHANYKLGPSKIEESNDHIIQLKSEKPYTSSSPGEFFQGVINPIKKRTTIINLNVDSRFRDNYYTSAATNYNITLPLRVKNVVRMQLSTIEIPKSYYIVSKQYGNNFFSISANGLSNVISIPSGNYSPTTIITAINYQLSLLPPPFNQITFLVDLTSDQTLVGFSNLLGNTSLELNFQADIFGEDDRNTSLPLKLGWLLGFRNGVYINNLNYVSEGPINTNGPSYLFLVLDDYKNNVNRNFYSALNSSVLNQNILARISPQINSSNSIHQNNLSAVTTARDYFGPVNIETMNVQLLDEYGRVVDLNYMDFSFCLNLTTAYDI